MNKEKENRVLNELALTESRALREGYSSRVDVLDRVQGLVLLPDDMHATTEQVAVFFGVSVEHVRMLVSRNHEELEANGYRVLTGADLARFKTEQRDVALFSGVRSLALFPRRAILNVAMLLRDSAVARQVRTHLLDVEATQPEVLTYTPVADPTAVAIAVAVRQVELEHATQESSVLIGHGMYRNPVTGEIAMLPDPAVTEKAIVATTLLVQAGLQGVLARDPGFSMEVARTVSRVDDAVYAKLPPNYFLPTAEAAAALANSVREARQRELAESFSLLGKQKRLSPRGDF